MPPVRPVAPGPYCMAQLVVPTVLPILLTAIPLQRKTDVVNMVLVLVLTVGGKLVVPFVFLEVTTGTPILPCMVPTTLKLKFRRALLVLTEPSRTLFVFNLRVCPIY